MTKRAASTAVLALPLVATGVAAQTQSAAVRVSVPVAQMLLAEKVYPQAIGVATGWDAPLLQAAGTAMPVEARGSFNSFTLSLRSLSSVVDTAGACAVEPGRDRVFGGSRPEAVAGAASTFIIHGRERLAP